VRQPKNLPEALATVKMLETKGYNFSLGLAQVNRYNLSKYGLDSYQKAFEACPNLKAGSEILAECYHRINGDWGKSFSCYYSGNSVTGFRHGYVQKIYSSMRKSYVPAQEEIAAAAIPVVGRSSRRVVEVKRHPVYATAGSLDSASQSGATQSRAMAAPRRIEQRTDQPMSKMQRIIASYSQPNLSASVAAPVPTEKLQLLPVQQTVQGGTVAEVQTAPAREPPVLLQPTNVSSEAVATSKNSAFVF
jgi:type IV secretion system protein VirB1